MLNRKKRLAKGVESLGKQIDLHQKKKATFYSQKADMGWFARIILITENM